MTFIQRVLICIFILGIWSCKQDSRIEKPSTDRIVVYSDNAPKGLNPLINIATSPILNLVNITLAQYNPKTLTFEPIMLKALPIDTVVQDEKYRDNFAYYFEFIEGLTWDDGTKIDMNDYIFTMKLIKSPSVNSPRLRAFYNDILDVIPNKNKTGGIVILDKYNLNGIEKITALPLIQENKFDSKHLLRSLSIPELRAKNYKEQEDKINGLANVLEDFNRATQDLQAINGNGRYKITKWKLDDFIQLERKEKHWSDNLDSSNPLLKAMPKTIIYSFMSDAAAALPQIKNGDFDIVPRMDFNSYESLKLDPIHKEKFRFGRVRLPRFYFIGLNTRKLTLQQQEVRKALQLVVNVDTIIATMENGYGTRVNSPFLNLGQDSEVETVQFDLAKAKQILSDSGWKDKNQDGILEKELNGKVVPLKLSMIITGKKLGNFIAALTKQDAAKVGIDIELISLETSAMRKKVRAHDFDIVVSGSTSSLADYDPYPGFHTNNVAPGKGNNYGFGDAKSDLLINRIRTEKDSKKRKKHYVELEKIIHDKVPMIFLYSPNERILLKKNLNCLLSGARPGYFANTAFFE